MKNWMINILAGSVGFLAGAYFMHVRMRKEYEKYAEAQIDDVKDPETPDRPRLEPIEIIEPEEFGCDDEYETSFLTLYKDGVLAYDSDGSKVDDVEAVVGQKALDSIGKFMPDGIHVRNHIYHKDYEVVKALQNYADVYRGREEEDYDE